MRISKGSRLLSPSMITAGEEPIGLFHGELSWDDPSEKQHVVDTGRRIIRQVLQTSGSTALEGLVRVDLVGKFSPARHSYDLGCVDLDGCYEVNTEAPECVAADAEFRMRYGDHVGVSAVRQIAQQMLRYYPDRRIVFIPSDQSSQAPIKVAWARSFSAQLQYCGVDACYVTPEQAMRITSLDADTHILYRWGDVPGQYSNRFVNWLYAMRDNRFTIINALPEPGRDPGDKRWLLNLDIPGLRHLHRENRSLLTDSDIRWGMQQRERLVLKPDNGASGDGIVFGMDTAAHEWFQELRNAKEEGGFCLWEFIPLP